METLYAKIEKGIVTNIEVVTDEFVKSNPERYKDHIKVTGTVGRGYTYKNKVFTAPQPFPSWILKNNIWEAPVKQPEGDYYWDESKGEWIKSEL